MMPSALLSYLVNSLWQVPLVLAAAALCARLVAPVSRRVEHRVWVIGLGLEVTLPACRVGPPPGVWWIVQHIYLFLHPAARFSSTIHVLYGPATAGARGLELPPSLISSALAAYAVLTAYFVLRFFVGCVRTNRLGREAQTVFHEGTQFSVSSAVLSPVTIGIRRSLLIVPSGFLERLKPEELQVVLAHERAHMLRLDYAKNVLYQAISLPIAYHPALALTRTRVTETREMVCDELAAASLTHGGTEYARVLLRLASSLFNPSQSVDLHAIGIFDAHIFERRIMNLTQCRPVLSPVRRFALIAACSLVAIATTASALALRVNMGALAVARQDEGQPKMSASLMASRLLLHKMPVYPVQAKLNRDIVDGAVVLDAVIGKDGRVQSLKVLKSLRADYDESALEAVKDWTYQPYLINGEPTEVETTITVNYSTEHTDR
jgi:TonB family protein